MVNCKGIPADRSVRCRILISARSGAERAYVTAYFPFPPGHSLYDTDYSSLQLRWQVQVDGRIIGQGAYFRRQYPSYYYDYGYGPYPYWGYPAPYYVGGVVVVHRRW